MDDDGFERLATAILRRAVLDGMLASLPVWERMQARAWLIGPECEAILDGLNVELSLFHQRLVKLWLYGSIAKNADYDILKDRTDERE